jgi:anti-anti-sigma factor
MGKGMLKAWVEAGESGPVIMLAGEADLTSAEQFDALITGQLAVGTCQLTIDVSELRFADAASIRTLALAARTLTVRGGSLVVLNPQPSVARVLALLGVDQMVTIRGKTCTPRTPSHCHPAPAPSNQWPPPSR